MKKRYRLKKRVNKRNFRHTASKTHKKNLTANVMRGGFRL